MMCLGVIELLTPAGQAHARSCEACARAQLIFGAARVIGRTQANFESSATCLDPLEIACAAEGQTTTTTLEHLARCRRCLAEVFDVYLALEGRPASIPLRVRLSRAPL